MSRVGFEPTILVFDRAKAFYALDQWYSTWGTRLPGAREDILADT
jgi:hypothetical protein